MLRLYREETGGVARVAEAEAMRAVEAELVRIPPREIGMRRAWREEEEIEGLAESIRRRGVLEPLLVCRTESGEISLIAGRRRLLAAMRVGLLTVPCIVLRVSEQESAELALLAEASHRAPNELAEAHAVSELLSAGGLSRAALARRLSVGEAYIEDRLCLFGLGEETARALLSAGLCAAHARALLSEPDPAERRALIALAARERLSPSELSEMILERRRRGEARALERRMRGAVADLGLLLNSLDRALNAARRAGLSVTCEQAEAEGETVITLRVQRESGRGKA